MSRLEASAELCRERTEKAERNSVRSVHTLTVSLNQPKSGCAAAAAGTADTTRLADKARTEKEK